MTSERMGRMDGIFFHGAQTGQSVVDEKVALLAKQGDLEIMTQQIDTGAVVWLSPAADAHAIEFFFVHAGEVELALDDGIKCVRAGESFHVSGLTRDIPLKVTELTELVYVTNCPAFDFVRRFEEGLDALLVRVNEKDHYTYRHSGNVLHYSLLLYDKLRVDPADGSRDDLAVAALFHDVGKCFVPVEILQKQAELEPSEARYIVRHPIDSGRMLRAEFGERVAEIAMNHHERLDGGGYPRGLSAEEISFAARIVSVADVFDAMTTDRGYNRVKTMTEASNELLTLPEAFDARITGALCELVRADEIHPKEEKKE